MPAQSFGTLPDGSQVSSVEIAAGDLRATIITYGAIIQDLRLEGVDHPLVLGFPTMERYLENPNYFGAVAGRFANRIRDGRFAIDGTPFQVTPNETPNHLHGGAKGFAERNWTILRSDAESVTLTLDSADGEEGYPGDLKVELTYRIESPSTLAMSVRATTDKATIVNLAQHSYFNLDGGETILDHLLTIPAETYLPVDQGNIPTGEFKPVEGTPFDFRQPKPVGQTGPEGRVLFDHNFVVTRARTQDLHLLARLASPKSGVALDISSTEPGVQFYVGHLIRSSSPGLDGASYVAHSGLCLEPQIFPDSPNRPDFPPAVLRPGETYRQETEFRFSR